MKRLLSAFLAAVTVLCTAPVYVGAEVTSADYTLEELHLNSYDLYRYTLPYWEGNLVYNECVFPIKAPDGSAKDFTLMYDASEIVSVRSYDLSVTYEEGVDYVLRDGKLYILPTGSIRLIDYSYIHPTSNPYNYDWTVYYPRAAGDGYEYWNEGTELSGYALSVTYIHNDTWDHPIPESAAASLPGTMEKLTNKEPLTIVVNGDSVAAGAHSSGTQGLYPYADAFPEMAASALAQKYGNDNVSIVNTAIGGTMSEYTETLLNDTVIKYYPDLVIINYGMNDSSCNRVGISKEEFKTNVQGRIDYIKSCLPQCEVLLVSSLFGNIYTFPRDVYEAHAEALAELAAENEGVGVTDPQAVMGSVIDSGKEYISFMADNMVHPNDYGMRLTAQAILAALDVEDIDAYRDTLIEGLREYAMGLELGEKKSAEVETLILETAAALSDVNDEWLLNEIIEPVYGEIDAIARRCDDGDHDFEDTLIPVTCNTDGYTHSVCTRCGYEYDHSTVTAPGIPHIMDSGRQTVSPTYKREGVVTYTCCTCGYEESETLPVLSSPPVLQEDGMLYVQSGLNYMQTNSVQPYNGGTGTVEFDICPTKTAFSSVSYAGVWFSNYSICAAYNFTFQQVEIVKTSLPYTGSVYEYASVPYEWTEDSGDTEYNWKKFAVRINGNTVRIYIDGELVLSDTHTDYSATTEVALPYTAGEFLLDNFKIVKGDYDPATGTGGYATYTWDLNGTDGESEFFGEWGLGGYTVVTADSATMANTSDATYKNHVHSLEYFATVAPTCSLGGYDEYLCTECGVIVTKDPTFPLYEDGHSFTEKVVQIRPTVSAEGLYTFGCERCSTTFTEAIPAVTEYLLGDVSGDGTLNSTDAVMLMRFLSGLSEDIDTVVGDMSGDGTVNSADLVLIQRSVAGLSLK